MKKKIKFEKQCMNEQKINELQNLYNNQVVDSDNINITKLNHNIYHIMNKEALDSFAKLSKAKSTFNGLLTINGLDFNIYKFFDYKTCLKVKASEKEMNFTKLKKGLNNFIIEEEIQDYIELVYDKDTIRLYIYNSLLFKPYYMNTIASIITYFKIGIEENLI